MAASGYDSRQAQRSSFAFTPAQPVQNNSTLNPGLRGGAVIGGDSGGGVVRASPLTLPQGDDGIPDFLAKLVEPVIRQKQEAAVVQGATDYIAGKSLKEIAKGDSGVVSKLFGPTGYRQGATTFAASDAVAKMRASIAADPDVEAMPTEQLGAYLAEKYKSVQTGDPLADSLVGHQLMEEHGPLVAALTQKQAAFQARQTSLVYGNDADSQTTALQGTATSLDLTMPAGRSALQQAQTTYAKRLLTRPFGMTVEAHQSAVATAMQNAARTGSFYAVEALKANGAYNLLTDKQQAQVGAAERAGAADAIARVAMRPEINARVALLDHDIKNTAVSPHDIAERAAQINAIVSAATGVTDHPYLSPEAIVSMQRERNGVEFAAQERLQTRQWQIEDRNAGFQHEEDMKRAEAAQDIAVASQYAGTGKVGYGLSVGTVKDKDANLVMSNAVSSGHVEVLASNFGPDGYVNKQASDQLQAPLAQAVGSGGPTKGLEQAHQLWQKLDAANPGAASAYFGSYAANMEAYDAAVKRGEEAPFAYAASFGRPPAPNRTAIPEGDKRKNLVSALDDAITAQDSGWISGGRTPLNAGSQALVRNALLSSVGERAVTSTSSDAQAATRVYQSALATGTLERAGAFAWFNPRGTTPISRMLSLPPEKADKLVMQVVDARMKAAGFHKGAYGDAYDVLRWKDSNTGEPLLFLRGISDDGSAATDVVLRLSDLKAAATSEAKTRVQANQPGARAPFKIDISSAGTSARREGYRHAMDR